MTIHITTLSENTAGRGDFIGEWGLSILVQSDDETLLFDTGKGRSAVHNADALGVDLGRIGKIVLSHAHYDHTGGLRELLRRMRKKVPVIAHPDIWRPRYSRRQEKKERYIGIPFQPEELESLGADFQLTAQPLHIGKGVMTTGEIPMVTDFEQIDRVLLVKDGPDLKPDRVMDDQALIIKTGPGLVVILGCAHRGIINTLYHAREIAGDERIHTVIGGSHLVNASRERLRRTAAVLRDLGVQKLGLCHCTGMEAACVLAGEFGERFFFNTAGTVIQVP